MIITIPPDAVLSRGAHEPGTGTCGRELLHLLVVGTHRDATPECLTACCSVLPPLNDGPWRDDAHRTSVIIPWLPRLAECPRDHAADQRRAYKLADIACREILPEVMDDDANRPESATKIRALPEVVDVATAYVTLSAARAAARSAAANAASARAAYFVADAASIAAYVACYAAEATAESAAAAAAASARAANVAAAARADAAANVARSAKAANAAAEVVAAAAIERWTNRLLGAICEVTA